MLSSFKHRINHYERPRAANPRTAMGNHCSSILGIHSSNSKIAKTAQEKNAKTLNEI